MHTTTTKANSQPQIIKDPWTEEFKTQGLKSSTTLPRSNKSKFFAKTWYNKKEILPKWSTIAMARMLYPGYWSQCNQAGQG